MIHFFATAERLERPTSYVIATEDLHNFDGKAIPTPFKDNLLTGKVSADPSPTQFCRSLRLQRNSDIYVQPRRFFRAPSVL